MSSFKTKAITISGIAVAICCAILILGGSILYTLHNVERNWHRFAEQSTTENQLLNKIHRHMGYGGTIHKFKNLVLRGELDKLDSIQDSFYELYNYLIEYQQQNISSEEQQAIQQIIEVISTYQLKLSVAASMIQQGAPVAEIDHQVKVDDTPAIEALNKLNQIAENRHKLIEQQTTSALGDISNYLTSAAIIVPAILIFAVILIAYLYRLYRINRRLLEAQRSLDALFESVPDAILATSKDGKLFRFNQQAMDLFGYEREEFLNKSIEDLMPQRFRTHHVSYREGYFKSPHERAMDKSATLYIERKDGKEIPVEISLNYIQEDGEYIAIATIRDISERQAHEKEIQASRTRLAEAQRIAKLGAWSLNFETGRCRWTAEVYTIFNLDPEQTEPSLDLYLKQSCSSEEDQLAALFKQHDAKGKQDYHLIRRLCLENGDTRYAREEGEITFNQYGEPISMLGTIRDITEVVLNREKLEQAAIVFEHTSDAVLITDAKRKIIAINKAFSKITGYTEEEVLGLNAGFTKSGRHSISFYQNMNRALQQKSYWQGEIWDRRKNGEIYPKWLTITGVKNERDILQYYVGVFSDISHIKSTEDKLRHLALHDSLTGLPNRLAYNEQLERAIKHADRKGQNLAVLFLDLDRFKNINDSLGHPVGDQVLKEVAARLKRSLRADDTIARLGGDEFTVIVEDTESPDHAAKIAEKIIEVLASPMSVDGHQLHITTSVGVSLYPKDGDNVTELVKNADVAMYRAKDFGRNRFAFYSEELAEKAVARLELEGELRKAITSRQFTLHYQPQFNLKDNSIIGAEALIRWDHPVRGMIPPDHFIPIAEETGLINDIGAFAMQEACSQLKQWHNQGWMLPKISVNVASQQVDSGQIVTLVADTLQETGISASNLEIELTETALMQLTDNTLSVLQELRNKGITISIDDFGTGYSSLSYLKTLPINKIKIDRSFVKDIPEDSNDSAITRAVIALSSTLQLGVIAEGLETEEQKQFLINEQCFEAQGYLYSRPLPADKLKDTFPQLTVTDSLEPNRTDYII